DGPGDWAARDVSQVAHRSGRARSQWRDAGLRAERAARALGDADAYYHAVTSHRTSEPRAFYSTGGLNVETYDVRTATPPGEIAFYVERARRSGGSVLELACGTGRITWPIARAGVRIVSLDLAEGMLARAESKQAGEDAATSGRARFVADDMTSFELQERFALAIIPFRA